MSEKLLWIFCYPCMKAKEDEQNIGTRKSAMKSPLISQESASFVTVVSDYDPKNDLEEGEDRSKYFILKKGDEIEVLERSPSGWWLGKLNGKEGYFPSNYVEEPQDSIVFETLRVIKAQADYKAVNDEELSLKDGEKIKVYKMFDDGWWYGETPNGKRGYFPYNYTTAYSYKEVEGV